MYDSIEKFMKSLGITYEVNLSRKGFSNRTGERFICMEVKVFYKNEIQFHQYFCYILNRNNELLFDEGNTIKDVRNGIFAYLGLDKEVYLYFNRIARNTAYDYIFY